MFEMLGKWIGSVNGSVEVANVAKVTFYYFSIQSKLKLRDQHGGHCLGGSCKKIFK